MSEYRSTQAVLHDEQLQCLIVIKALFALLNNRALARDERVVNANNGYAVRLGSSAMSPLATMSLVTSVAP